MKRSFQFSVVLLALTAGTAVWADSGRKSKMKAWKTDLANLQRIAGGKAAFEGAEAGRILKAFADEAGGFEARLTGASARGKDLKSRFARFGSDAANAAAAADTREKLGQVVVGLGAQCKGCRDVHAN